jgi:hypothetical protein
MDIRVNFNTTEQRDAFAKRWALDIPEDVDHLDVPWHLYQHAKNDPNAQSFTQLDGETEHHYIVSGKKEQIESVATIIKNMGADWFLVSSNQGVELGKVVDSIEINSVPMKFLENVSTINEMNVDSTTIDPTSAEGQWARIRVASQYRPLATSFSTHDVAYVSKPELFIMDTGIDFTHPEFDYEGLEKVDFYSLPVFNGNFRDDIGHGTGVASMAVGKNLGVASHAKLMNVKIGGKVDGVSYSANLIEVGEAIDAIVNYVVTNLTGGTRIINMSWGVARSSWLDAKVQSLLDLGVTVICAAGNSGISVEDISPAGLDTVITVGAIDKYDIPAGFNNISPTDSGLTTASGLSLDIFAPGDNVMIASIGTGEFGTEKYAIASGTSFSAPLVAGVAVVVASMNKDSVFYGTMKDIILNTATEHALLFEDDRFSDNQNRLVYLVTTDPMAAYKQTESVSYLGVHGEDDVIVADLNSNLNTATMKTLFPDLPIEYSVEIAEDSIEYAPFFSCNSETGIVTITKPDLPLPEETRLKMVNFTGKATIGPVVMLTNTIFFFVSNPTYADTLQSDITLALTDINSISFFAYWSGCLK